MCRTANKPATEVATLSQVPRPPQRGGRGHAIRGQDARADAASVGCACRETWESVATTTLSEAVRYMSVD